MAMQSTFPHPNSSRRDPLFTWWNYFAVVTRALHFANFGWVATPIHFLKDGWMFECLVVGIPVDFISLWHFKRTKLQCYFCLQSNEKCFPTPHHLSVHSLSYALTHTFNTSIHWHGWTTYKLDYSGMNRDQDLHNVQFIVQIWIQCRFLQILSL